MMKIFQRLYWKRRKGLLRRGPRAIEQELKRKGIGKELQEKVLDSYSEEEQVEVAKGLAQKEASRNRSQSPRQTEQRIQNLLLRRGYSYDIIKQALTRY